MEDIDVEGFGTYPVDEEGTEESNGAQAENAAEVLHAAAQTHDTARRDIARQGEKILRVHTN